MTYPRVFLIALAIVLFSGFGMAAPKGQSSPTGSLVLVGTPTQGGTAEFAWTCANLPQNGGASIGCWVELICETETAVVVHEVVPATVINHLGNQPAIFSLPVTNPFQVLSCDAYLFWDGWNGPRRRKTNTLAAVFFSVS